MRILHRAQPNMEDLGGFQAVDMTGTAFRSGFSTSDLKNSGLMKPRALLIIYMNARANDVTTYLNHETIFGPLHEIFRRPSLRHMFAARMSHSFCRLGNVAPGLIDARQRGEHPALSCVDVFFMGIER